MKFRRRISDYTFVFWVLIVSYIFISIFISGCSKVNEVNVYSDKEKIEKTIGNSIGWALNKDTNILFESFSRGTELFILHPDSGSSVNGFEEFKKRTAIFLNPKFKATDFKLKNLRIDISESGDVAWYFCNLDDHCEWDGKPVGWDNVRWTGVLEKRNNNWVIVQMHFSFPK